MRLPLLVCQHPGGEQILDAVEVDLVSGCRTAWFEVVDAGHYLLSELPGLTFPRLDFGDPRQRTLHVLAAAERTRRVLEDVLGRPLLPPAQAVLLSPAHTPVDRPRAAYARYTHGLRAAISFAFSRDRTWHACALPDVIAHEVAHALWEALSGWRPDDLTRQPQTAPIAEALSDLVAVLARAASQTALEHVLADCVGDLRRPNGLSRIGEDRDGEYQRDLASAPTWDEVQGASVHEQGQVIAAACYLAFAGCQQEIAPTADSVAATREALQAALGPLFQAAAGLALSDSGLPAWPTVQALLQETLAQAPAGVHEQLYSAFCQHHLPGAPKPAIA